MPMTRNPSSLFPPYPGNFSSDSRRRSNSACSTYAATNSAVATINPNVGIVSGPKCKNGIIYDLSHSLSNSSVYIPPSTFMYGRSTAAPHVRKIDPLVGTWVPHPQPLEGAGLDSAPP